MNARLRLEHVPIVLLVVAFVFAAGAFSLIVPLGEAPDEVSHFGYIRYLIENRQLPKPQGPAAGEAHQPPLYYLIGALSTGWLQANDWQVIANPDFSLNDPQVPNLLLHTRIEAFPYHGAPLAWHLVRLLSVLMGAVTVWGTYRIGLVLFASERSLSLAGAALAAFIPGFTFVSGMVNNDNLVIMFTTLGIFQVLRLQNHSPRIRDLVVPGLILGLAALSKLSGLVLWIFAFTLFLVGAFRSRQWRLVLRNIVVVFGTAILVDLPWFIYNQANFGDPLGWSQVIAITPARQSPMALTDWLAVFRGLFTSFAGRFGGALQLSMPDAYYWVFAIAMLVAVIGWFRQGREAEVGEVDVQARKSLFVFGLFWLILLAAYARWTTTSLGTDQARQLFPGLALFAIVLAFGIARLIPGGARTAALTLGAVGAVLATGLLIYVRLLYASPVEFAPIDSTASSSDFGQTIRVVDYSIGGVNLSRGGSVAVEINWQALSAPKEDYWLQLELVGARGPVAYKDGIPSAGRRTTDWWQKGEILTSRHTIVVPQDALPGAYILVLGLHPFGRWDWLPVDGRDRLVLGEIRVD